MTRWTLLALAMLTAMLVLAGPMKTAHLQEEGGTIQPDVLAALDAADRVDVVVHLLAPPLPPPGAFTLDTADSVEQDTASLQARVLADLDTGDFKLTYRYTVVPALAGQITSAGLERLEGHPDVITVASDVPLFLTALTESVALIRANAPGLQSLGIDGSGVNVALLDSGIAGGHADLTDSLVGEECFADCVGGGNRQSGPGSAEDESNGHGSYVAGIITSDGITPGVSPGVAPGAGIFAYKVLGGPGVGAPSLMLAALDHVLSTTLTLNAAGLPPLTPLLNMSLGDGNRWVAGTCRPDQPAIEQTLGYLRLFGVLSFAASGNAGFKDGISWPACYPSVVAVGAVYDADTGPAEFSCTDPTTTPDQVACFSQSSDDLGLLAPGAQITSVWPSLPAPSSCQDPFPGGVTCGGTSAATPHAVGTAALVKQILPGASPDEIEQVLKETGALVTDSANGITTPRVDAKAAVLDHDFDGDGCTNRYELGDNPELGGLNDPFNPNDCTTVLSADGLYEISHDFDDGQRRCMGAVYLDGGDAEMRVYCYTDSTIHEVNPQAYENEYGDGLPGAPPPGPAAVTPCGDFWFDVNEVPPLVGIACDYVYGDVDGSHTVLTGSRSGDSLSIAGCFENIEGLDPLGHILVLFIFNFKTGAGSSFMFPNQPDLEDCKDLTPFGTPDTGTLQALKLATTTQMDACYTTDPDCAFADNDPPFVDRTGDGIIDDRDKGDGVPDHVELRDDAACGLRDPLNINDFYDVSIPRDGKIDLFAGINGVIANIAPFGYSAGDPAFSGPGTMENYDRRPAMIGSNAWNHGSPDGKIDLFTDIAGVIAMYAPFGPVGCP